ncbi:unnamed protein product [Adineta steineri]|uniref:Peptidase S59 domain-containing protein n=1 Tax=Adineta steineri TaxID=433720 RepID=A0A814K4T6_9BILA|nr:unnamed protein product [Adineta steineri]CAF1259922.1 unnamed protein product [Adineta steineri]
MFSTSKSHETTSAGFSTFKSPFTYPPVTTSQVWNPFGTSSASTIQPVVNQSTSTGANFTPTGHAGWTPFGTNQPTSVTQPANIFASNPTGPIFNFGAGSTQGTVPTTSTTSNIFGINKTVTTTASPFGMFPPTISTTTSNLFNQPSSSASTIIAPWAITPTPNISTVSTLPQTHPFNITPTTTSGTTSVFNTATIINPFNIKTTTASGITPVFNAPTVTNPFNTQPVTSGNIFSQTMITTTSANSTNPTTTGNYFHMAPTTTISVFPSLHPPVSTANTTPNSNMFAIPSSLASISNPQPFQILPVTQTQPVTTSSSSSTISQEEQNPQQSVSNIHQQFLAASLLDPYANRGKKDFTKTDQIQMLTEPAVVSASSTTLMATSAPIFTTPLITSTPISAVLPIQSNFQKIPSSRSLIDVNFKLKPASSSSSLHDDIKSSQQQSTASIEQIKGPLSGSFTDEEENILLSRTKMSKLRISNDIIDSPYQSNTIRSLYPLRNLNELEKLTNIPPLSSSVPVTTSINNKRTPSPIPSITSEQRSSSVIQQKSNTNSSTCRLPILTREDYYMKPNLTELKSLFNDKNQCIVKQFTVGHEKYGSVTFYGQINLAGLNLDEIIEINHHEVIVYPDDNNKPSVGEELNRSARITLLGVYPTDRTTHEQITDIERIKAMNYDNYLREITKKFDGEFIKYGVDDGSWTFMVKHFTRYGLDNDNQDDVIIKTISQQQP